MKRYGRFLLGTGLVLVASAVLAGWKWHPGEAPALRLFGSDSPAGGELTVSGRSGVAVTGQGGFAVVELFTSEGCSSCPPAEALMARTQHEDQGLSVYCLAFHVDYWDRLGWKDVFSDAAYTDRQKQYSRWLRLNEIYTPQVVVNGTTEFVGSDEGQMNKAIKSGLEQKVQVQLALHGLRQSAGRLDWQCKVDGLSPIAGRHLNLVVAVVEKNAVTQVKGGENSGKTLSQAQIVRELAMQPPDANVDGAGHIDWPTGLDASNAEVIAFLQDQDSGKVVAATRASLQK
jgi:hypothetical protein